MKKFIPTIKSITPLRAIREKCMDCCCGNRTEIRLCPSKDCPLWLFRFGHNPKRVGVGGNPEL
jgi:hypothetical protein